MYQQPMNFQPPEIIHQHQSFAPENQGETNFNAAPEIFINPETVFGEQPSAPESIVDIIERDISVILLKEVISYYF